MARKTNPPRTVGRYMRSRTLLLRLECGLVLGLFFVLVELLKAFRAWSYAGQPACEWAGVAVVLRIYTAFLFLWAQGRPRPMGAGPPKAAPKIDLPCGG